MQKLQAETDSFQELLEKKGLKFTRERKELIHDVPGRRTRQLQRLVPGRRQARRGHVAGAEAQLGPRHSGAKSSRGGEADEEPEHDGPIAAYVREDRAPQQTWP